jgi:hypothetical protein
VLLSDLIAVDVDAARIEVADLIDIVNCHGGAIAGLTGEAIAPSALGSWEGLTVAIVDVVKAFENFDWNTCNGDENFGRFNSTGKDKAENILPALPILGIGLGHGAKAVEQDLEDFRVRFIGVLAT